jgi:hypothetical protein
MNYKNITVAGSGVLGSQIAYQTAFKGFTMGDGPLMETLWCHLLLFVHIFASIILIGSFIMSMRWKVPERFKAEQSP